MNFTPEFVVTLPNSRPPSGIPSAHAFYYTGKPCKHGHTAPRYVSSGGCTACVGRTIVRARIPGATYVTFPLLVTDPTLAQALRADPGLADKVGIILFNYRALAEQLVGWARAGWAGQGEPAAVLPEPEPADSHTFKVASTGQLFLWRHLKADGWTAGNLREALRLGQLVEE